MNKQEMLAYLLLYAANIDAHIDAEEKKIIRQKLSSKEEWKKVRQVFEDDSDPVRTEKITYWIENASEEQKKDLLVEVKKLMQADGDFSVAENYLLKLLGHF